MAGLGRAQCKDPHWPRDILDALLAHVLEGEVEPVAYLIADDPADADPARFSQAFETRRNVHSISEDIVLLRKYVADEITRLEDSLAVVDSIAERNLELDMVAAGMEDTPEAARLAQQVQASGPTILD